RVRHRASGPAAARRSDPRAGRFGQTDRGRRPRRRLRRDLPPHRAPLCGQDRGVAARHERQIPEHRGAEHVSIKSDRWIRRMAAEHRMIEPFEAGQVKEAAGRRIVSYGTSSYGYDIRCSTEFKIFTNINSTIVDP